MNTRSIYFCLLILPALLLSPGAKATGLATCDSGPEEGWIQTEILEEQLTEDGWQVRRIKVDGGCYEVYALDNNGERVEAYFHPETLARIPIEDDDSSSEH